MEIKKIVSALVSAAMAFSLLSLVPIRVSAVSDASGTGWSFTAADGKLQFDSKFSEEKLTVGLINGLDGNKNGGDFQVNDIRILNTTGNTSFKTIEPNAFKNCTSLTKIILPNVSAIGKYAFYGCTSLASVYLPEVTAIKAESFVSCTNLKELNLPKATSIGEKAFSNCNSLTTVTIPELTEVENETFRGCKCIKTLNLPKTTTVGDSAFANCTSLSSISLPDAESIGVQTFENCKFLTSVSVPKAKYLGSSAFKYCSSLEKIDLTDIISVGDFAFEYCPQLTVISFNQISPPTLGAEIFGMEFTSKYIEDNSYISDISISVPQEAEESEWIEVFGTAVKIVKHLPTEADTNVTPKEDVSSGTGVVSEEILV